MPEQEVGIRTLVMYSKECLAEREDRERIMVDFIRTDEDFGCPR
jgi:hypothetical protein